MFGIKLMLKLASLSLIILKFSVPKVIEIVHFFMVSLVDFVDFVFVSDLHFVDSPCIELFSELLGANSVGFSIYVITIFLVLGHYYKDLVELCL